MTILELLKSEKYTARLSLNNQYWIYYDEDSNNWVVCYYPKYTRSPRLNPFISEEDAVDYMLSEYDK